MQANETDVRNKLYDCVRRIDVNCIIFICYYSLLYTQYARTVEVYTRRWACSGNTTSQMTLIVLRLFNQIKPRHLNVVAATTLTATSRRVQPTTSYPWTRVPYDRAHAIELNAQITGNTNRCNNSSPSLHQCSTITRFDFAHSTEAMLVILLHRPGWQQAARRDIRYVAFAIYDVIILSFIVSDVSSSVRLVAALSSDG